MVLIHLITDILSVGSGSNLIVKDYQQTIKVAACRRKKPVTIITPLTLCMLGNFYDFVVIKITFFRKDFEGHY